MTAGSGVSNNTAGYLGRMNKSVSQLDGGLFSPGGETTGFDTDLVQSGDTLIVWDKAGGHHCRQLDRRQPEPATAQRAGRPA